MGRRAGRDDERRMPNCCRWGRAHPPAGGRWRVAPVVVMRVVTAPQSAADSRGDSSEQSGGESFELRYMAGEGVSPC